MRRTTTVAMAMLLLAATAGLASSGTQLEKKVKDYLRNSQTLEDYRQRPIINRMARNNDPFVIAECLARPTLAERLLVHRNLSNSDLTNRSKQPLFEVARRCRS
ncbi:MAG TPA: hypothetical protein VGK91_07025 [Candidatus Udaeobacter sp.]